MGRGYGSECCALGLKSGYIEYWDGEELGIKGKGHWVLVGRQDYPEQIYYCPYCGHKL